MNWRPTNGVKPRTQAQKVFVKYRCGMVSKEPVSVSTTRWGWSGHDFDVMAYFAAEEKAA